MTPQMSTQINCFIDTTLSLKGKLSSVRYNCGLRAVFREPSTTMSVGEWFIYYQVQKCPCVEHLIMIDCTDNSVLHFFVWFLRGRRPTHYFESNPGTGRLVCTHLQKKGHNQVDQRVIFILRLSRILAWEVWSGTVHPKAGDTNQRPPAKPDYHPVNF